MGVVHAPDILDLSMPSTQTDNYVRRKTHHFFEYRNHKRRQPKDLKKDD